MKNVAGNHAANISISTPQYKILFESNNKLTETKKLSGTDPHGIQHPPSILLNPKEQPKLELYSIEGCKPSYLQIKKYKIIFKKIST